MIPNKAKDPAADRVPAHRSPSNRSPHRTRSEARARIIALASTGRWDCAAAEAHALDHPGARIARWAA
jgi:hypothetical protein